MTQVVVDTDVVSFLFKKHPIGRQYDPDLIGCIALISFMTVAEVERWAIQYRWGEHRLHWLRLYLNRFTVTATALLYGVGVPLVTLSTNSHPV